MTPPPTAGLAAPPPGTTTAVARAAAVSKVFGAGPTAVTALDRVDIAFAAGFSSVRQFNDTVKEVFAVDPTTALFVEDMARNLPPAKAIGMTTVWVDNGSEQAPGTMPDGIDYRIAELSPWLHEILEHA